VRSRIESLSPRVLTIVAAGAVLLFAAAAWFVVVSPKRADAASVSADLAAARSRLADAELALASPRTGGQSVADVFRLSKAMPSSKDQSGLVHEISRLAKASGVTLEGVTPQAPVAGVGGPTLIPVSVAVRGRYFAVMRFLKRARTLVTVRRGKISAKGRLLSVRSVALTESDTGKYPELDATIGLDAYVYDGPIAQAEAPDPESGDEELSPDSGTAAGSTS
jgi:Tfp pilus assembly protein PilO